MYCQKCKTEQLWNFCTCTVHHSACFSSSDDALFCCLSNISFSCSVAVFGTYTGWDRSSCKVGISMSRLPDFWDVTQCCLLLGEWFPTFQTNCIREPLIQRCWVTSQKILILNYIAVKTWNPTSDVYFLQTFYSIGCLRNMEYMLLGLKEHTKVLTFHKTVHTQNNLMNKSKSVYSTVWLTTKVHWSTKRTFGNAARLSSGSLFTKGLQGPWIEGQSVCHIFLILIIWFPDWVRSKLTHLITSSREWLWQFTRCRCPFTRTENKDFIHMVMECNVLYVYLHHVNYNVQTEHILVYSTKPQKWETLLDF